MDLKKQKPLILIDGSSYLYRAFHALPALSNSVGQPTGAIYGVVTMLKKLLSEYEPEKIAVVFDSKGKTFRHALYDLYKANRAVMPKELQSQISFLHDVVRAMGLPLLMVEGVEADDVIATLATAASKKNQSVLISTGDKDIVQIVDENITLVNTMTESYLDAAGVKNKFGVYPAQMIDYLTLIGDASDNLPGVPNVGPKTAVKWLNEYGSLDALVLHAADITGKVGEHLRASLDQLPQLKQLVTLKTDVDLDYTMDDLHYTGSQNEALIKLFTTLEFNSLLSELLKAEKKIKTKQYDIILDEALFLVWLEKLKNSVSFAIDTETTGLDTISAQLVGISFSVEVGSAAYVPLNHQGEQVPMQLPKAWVLEKLKPLLENKKIKKIGQNIKYDIGIFENEHISIENACFDTMLESYVLDSMGRHDMDFLALKYLGYRTIHYEDVAGKGAKQKNFSEVSVVDAGEYAAEDADMTLRLHEQFWPRIQKEETLKKIFCDIEMPLIPVLARIERAGVLIDANQLRQHSQELEQRLQLLEKQAFEEAGCVFNLNSPKQLQEILFGKLGLPSAKKTPKGQPSTAEEVLQELSYDYRLPQLIMLYRTLNKLKTTYTDRLPEEIHLKTGRVHTSYHQAVTATGRLSSSNPNLQNIPARTAEGRRIRQAFIAPPGYQLIRADYSQVELRIMAHLSDDERLLKAFRQKIDVHRATAADVLGIAIDQVTPTQRQSAKAVNFGLIYGMSAFGLARQLGIEKKEAQLYVDRYFQYYPGVKHYMEVTREKARTQGYIETLWGRRLYLPDIRSAQLMRRQAAERTAINAPMQGTAADIIKQAMIMLDEKLRAAALDARMIMQVHDELVLEVVNADAPAAQIILKEAMENAIELKIPLLVEIGVGQNWNEASKYA